MSAPPHICSLVPDRLKPLLLWLNRLIPYFLVCTYFSEIIFPFNSVLLTLVVMWALVPQKQIEQNSFLQQLEGFEQHLWKNFKIVSDWIWSLRVPLAIVTLLAFNVSLVRVWIIALLLYPVIRFAFLSCPETLRDRVCAYIPSRVRNSPALSHLNEGMDQSRPFVLFWLYLCCAPFALSWMGVHWCKGLFRQSAKTIQHSRESKSSRLTFSQNSNLDSAESDNNFYHSRAFAVTMLAVFALGIPAWFSLAVYKQTGMDRLLAASPAVSVDLPQYRILNALPPRKPEWISDYRRSWKRDDKPGKEDWISENKTPDADWIAENKTLDADRISENNTLDSNWLSDYNAPKVQEHWISLDKPNANRTLEEIFEFCPTDSSPDQVAGKAPAEPVPEDVWQPPVSRLEHSEPIQITHSPPGEDGAFVTGDIGPPDQKDIYVSGALGPPGEDATFVTDYTGFWPFLRDLGIEPTLDTIFFVHFYIFSVASVLAMLFFRAWFTFPLNFLTDEHKVEVSETGIRRHSHKGWFLYVLTLNKWAGGGGCYDSLRWEDVKCLRHQEEGFTKLCPLPETAFKKSSLTYKLLNKFAALIDGLCRPMNTGSFIVFSMGETANDHGCNIKVNLNELTRDQRARLFYSVKKWAPHVVTTEAAEEKLLGSTVLNDVRYTQIWFDLLTSKVKTQRQSVLAPGECLRNGEYTINDRLSSGGQATAYLATTTSGQTCVLKEFILSTASSSSGALIESAREFEAEVSLLSQLNHEGIVRVQDFFAEEGRVYVVLEHVLGQSLRRLVKHSGPLAQKEVVRIALELCDILSYLHSQNPPIVHRDVTPENIIIQPDGRIKLIDFSLALKQDSRQTTDSCGKHAYTPPEQFRDEVTGQSDIYALGSTMHFLLTGVNPKPLTRSSPQSKAQDVSNQLNHIVERATELELDRRYESVDWLKLELEAIASGSSESSCSADDTGITPLLEKLALATECGGQASESDCVATSLTTECGEPECESEGVAISLTIKNEAMAT